jgi:hypothetical protein
MAARHGGDHRGSSYSRRARKLWMLATFGNGETVTCVHEPHVADCPVTLTFATVEADRKIPGGPYARWNIQPASRACNLARSNNAAWVPPGLTAQGA